MFRRKSIIFFAFLFIVNHASAQNCAIDNVQRKIIDYSNFGKIFQDYEGLKLSNVNIFTIVLIKFSNNNRIVFSSWLSIDSINKSKIKIESQDTVISTKTVDLKTKNIRDSILMGNLKKGFFACNCGTQENSHSSEILIICNNSLNIWTEIVSLNGDLKGALLNNKEFASLNMIYHLISSISEYR
jgi:hypothetical protein